MCPGLSLHLGSYLASICPSDWPLTLPVRFRFTQSTVHEWIPLYTSLLNLILVNFFMNEQWQKENYRFLKITKRINPKFVINGWLCTKILFNLRRQKNHHAQSDFLYYLYFSFLLPKILKLYKSTTMLKSHKKKKECFVIEMECCPPFQTIWKRSASVQEKKHSRLLIIKEVIVIAKTPLTHLWHRNLPVKLSKKAFQTFAFMCRNVSIKKESIDG